MADEAFKVAEEIADALRTTPSVRGDIIEVSRYVLADWEARLREEEPQEPRVTREELHTFILENIPEPRLLGHREEEVIGKHVYDKLFPDEANG